MEREEKANLIKELNEGYRARKKEDNELALDPIEGLQIGKTRPADLKQY